MLNQIDNLIISFADAIQSIADSVKTGLVRAGAILMILIAALVSGGLLYCVARITYATAIEYFG